MTDKDPQIEEIDKDKTALSSETIEQNPSETTLQNSEANKNGQQLATDEQTQIVNEQTQELDSLRKKNSDLESLIAQLQKENNELDPSKVKKILAVVKVNSVKWLCAEVEDRMEWYKEDDFLTKTRKDNQDFNMQIPQEIDYAQEIEAKGKENKQIKDLKAQLDHVITQYENRVLYVQQQLDITENKLHTTTQQYKRMVAELENKLYETFLNLSSMTDISAVIRENEIMASQDEFDLVAKNDLVNKIKTLSQQLKQFHFEGEQKPLENLKLHFLDIHQTLLEFIRKQGVLTAELQNLEKRTTKRWETLFAEKENERKEKNEIVEMGRKKIKEFEENIQLLKAQHLQEIHDKDSKIDLVQNELKKNANIDYIRTVLINFLTNPDFSVREPLLNVLATILKFSEGELEKVRIEWEKEHTSFIKKGSSTVSNWINDRFFSNK